jgi:hypothetical protein
MWADTPPRSWYGVEWPGSGWGGDNPDNLYRYLMIDGASDYELSGQRTGSGPAQETFLLYAAIPGTQAQSTEGAPVVSSLRDEDIKVEPDGSFTITIGPVATVPHTNHLQSGLEGRMIVVRDTLADWTSQFPTRLKIQRVAGPNALPPRSDAAVADEAAALLKVQAPYWLNYFQEKIYSATPNTVRSLGARAGGWGLLSMGWYRLKDDEALIVTLDPLSAAYCAIQVTDPWAITPDYITHTSSLNKAQAKANSDGTYTYVISGKDPGLWNWVDTVGMHLGTYTIRWQRLADSSSVANAVRSTQVARIADLKKLLPPETVWINDDERKHQQQERAASFALRLAN